MKKISKYIYPKAALVLENGAIFEGQSIGASGTTIGEICFNTAMTGYQEAISDSSYAGQILTFTFPHVGITGTNNVDIESKKIQLKGVVFRERPTTASNWRSNNNLNEWLKKNNTIGICSIDTRSLTFMVRNQGALKGLIVSDYKNSNKLSSYVNDAKKWSGLVGSDLAKNVSCKKPYVWNEKNTFRVNKNITDSEERAEIVAIDYGCKNTILSILSSKNLKITVVPANYPAKKILDLKPNGVFLSNGPGDPYATGKYAVSIIKDLIQSKVPIFGICLGHQLLCLALGAKTKKMHHGHHGVNQPVKRNFSNKVEITSQNHGFVVTRDSLPLNVKESHTSLFSNIVEGIEVKNKKIFSVQYHPEASPGPNDSYYLFDLFKKHIVNFKRKNKK